MINLLAHGGDLIAELTHLLSQFNELAIVIRVV